MNNFMKLFTIFVVLLQIQISMSQSIQSLQGPNLIQQVCKNNRYQTLCISTLNQDQRSKTSNLQGLASIALDATTKIVKITLQHFVKVFATIRERGELERYGTCIDQDYGAAVSRYLPAVMANLKAKNYLQAISNIKDVVAASDDCEGQYAGKSPESARNKAVHDIADMTYDIFKFLLKAH